MINKPELFNDYYKQDIFCVCCNNLIANVHDTDLKNLRFTQHNAKVNGFDLICYSCVQKLRKGKKLFV